MKQNKYIEDITEAEPQARAQGDQQVLVAGEKCEDCTGCDKCVKQDVHGGQSKEYYADYK